jgi:hypothetical protein
MLAAYFEISPAVRILVIGLIAAMLLVPVALVAFVLAVLFKRNGRNSTRPNDD